MDWSMFLRGAMIDCYKMKPKRPLSKALNKLKGSSVTWYQEFLPQKLHKHEALQPTTG
jgi:hypothetical protein